MLNFFLAECGSNCNYCAINGGGKCDPTYCKTGYVYQSSSKMCARMYYEWCCKEIFYFSLIVSYYLDALY